MIDTGFCEHGSDMACHQCEVQGYKTTIAHIEAQCDKLVDQNAFLTDALVRIYRGNGLIHPKVEDLMLIAKEALNDSNNYLCSAS